MQASHVVVDCFELSLGGRGQDGQLVEGPTVASVDVARLLVVLTGSPVVGGILSKTEFKKKLTMFFAYKFRIVI